jgi:hypothetical protein
MYTCICIQYLLGTAIGLMPGGSVTETMNNDEEGGGGERGGD